MARSTSFVSLLAMKLWTKSSIQTCQARLFRGPGAFLFDSAGLGDGLASGVGVTSIGVGEGEGEASGTVGDGCADCCGIGVGETTSVFFCERIAQSASRTTAARTNVAMTNGFHFAGGFFSPAGARCFIAVSAERASAAPGTVSVDCSSNSLIARATGGMCFEIGCESASSQWGVLR